MNAAEDAVAERLSEGLAALEGAPAGLKRAEVNLAGRLRGTESPNVKPGDETEREQEVPSDSRLDSVGSLQGRFYHFVMLSLERLRGSSGTAAGGALLSREVWGTSCGSCSRACGE